MTRCRTSRAGSPCRSRCGTTPGCRVTVSSSARTRGWRSGTPRHGRTTSLHLRISSPRCPRRCCPASSDTHENRAPADARSSETWRLAPARGTWRTFPGARRRGRGPAPTSRAADPRRDVGGTDRMDEQGTGSTAASSSGGPARPMHVPVMLDRVLELLAPAVESSSAVLVDATLGLGGHAAAVLARHPHLHLIGLDRDPRALAIAGDRLAAFRSQVTLVHAVFDALPDVLRSHGVAQIDAALFDLGVSSMQLDEDERGFAYSRDTALDMRMDPEASLTAAEVVNTYPVDRLARVLAEYGEEPFAPRIATAIARARADRPLNSTA